jgi:hypothetical protein
LFKWALSHNGRFRLIHVISPADGKANAFQAGVPRRFWFAGAFF